MRFGLYKNKAWVISAFTLFKDPNAWKKKPYAYRLVRTDSKYFFCNPENPQDLIAIEDSDPTVPLFRVHEAIEVKPDELLNVTTGVTTDYGRVLANCIMIIYAFGQKIEFINKEFSIGTIESIIIKDFQDTPLDAKDKKPGVFYVDEYLLFAQAADHLKGFTQVFCWAGTEKSLTTHPDVNQRKKELLAQFKGRLNDPAVIAYISAELVKMDAEHLKADPSRHFYLSKKSKEVVRSKMFLIGGAEVGLEENTIKVDLIPNSLKQGWDINKMPTMINSLRAGSYNRGAQTVLGGVAVKQLLRASSNLRVVADDCRSRIGKTYDVTKENTFRLIGRYVIEKDKDVLVESAEQAGAYLGKRLMVRSPQYCRLDKTDYCKKCVGTRLSVSPYALSMAVSDYGSTFLYIYMKAAHGKATVVQKMDLESVLY